MMVTDSNVHAHRHKRTNRNVVIVNQSQTVCRSTEIKQLHSDIQNVMHLCVCVCLLLLKGLIEGVSISPPNPHTLHAALYVCVCVCLLSHTAFHSLSKTATLTDGGREEKYNITASKYLRYSYELYSHNRM